MIIYWPTDIIILNNLYLKAYSILISKAIIREFPNDAYSEKHHIVPRSMGGSNNILNIVKLTAKEHYLAHRFLTRFTTDNHRYKMLYALDAMGMQSRNTDSRFRMPSRVYQHNRLELSKIGHSEETKRKIGLANKGRAPANKGKPRSEETRRKISLSRLGEKNPMFGRSFERTPEIRKAVGAFMATLTWINNPKLQKRKRVIESELQAFLDSGWQLGNKFK